MKELPTERKKTKKKHVQVKFNSKLKMKELAIKPLINEKKKAITFWIEKMKNEGVFLFSFFFQFTDIMIIKHIYSLKGQLRRKINLWSNNTLVPSRPFWYLFS